MNYLNKIEIVRDHREVGKYWDKNAENWTNLSRLGYDKYRNHVNSPEFFRILPNISELNGLDIGCGEGYNTRLATKKGARMTAIDISEVFIKHAVEKEKQKPLGIIYQVESALALPFENNSFDFVISTMVFMDMPDIDRAFKQIFRVLKPDGFFQFSITHPCFSPPIPQWVYDDKGKKSGLIVRDYFKKVEGDIEEWIFSAAPKKLTKEMKKFQVPRFNRTLSYWLNTLIDVGFTLEYFSEPYANNKIIKEHPSLKDTRIIAYFLIIRCRK